MDGDQRGRRRTGWDGQARAWGMVVRKGGLQGGQRGGRRTEGPASSRDRWEGLVSGGVEKGQACGLCRCET